MAYRHPRVVPLAVYLASWTGWLVTRDGYDRNYAELHGVHTPIISALYSLYEYHVSILRFGVTLHKTHPYMSQPWDCLVITRPVASTTAARGYLVPHRHRPNLSRSPRGSGRRSIWWAPSPRSSSASAGGCCTATGARAPRARRLRRLAHLVPFVSRTKFYFYALEFERSSSWP